MCAVQSENEIVRVLEKSLLKLRNENFPCLNLVTRPPVCDQGEAGRGDKGNGERKENFEFYSACDLLFLSSLECH